MKTSTYGFGGGAASQPLLGDEGMGHISPSAKLPSASRIPVCTDTLKEALLIFVFVEECNPSLSCNHYGGVEKLFDACQRKPKTCLHFSLVALPRLSFNRAVPVKGGTEAKVRRETRDKSPYIVIVH